MVELVSGGSDINEATPSSFSVSVLLLASVERFGVSRMLDLFFKYIYILHFQNNGGTLSVTQKKYGIGEGPSCAHYRMP